MASRTLDVKAVEVGAGADDDDVEHVAVANKTLNHKPNELRGGRGPGASVHPTDRRRNMGRRGESGEAVEPK